MTYTLPEIREVPTAPERTVITVANGDQRQPANETCWPTQQQLEADVTAAVEANGWSVQRGHEVDADLGHGFISSQRQGLEVFRTIPRQAPLIVVDAVWQYSQQVMAGLRSHEGPILLVANWAGDFPGLV
ncbi:MAG: hypothetical protein L0G99_05495, partial [Propionibacteriales bacterium]|nr:hypothetical protein [Propionibacteriales bacterium]